MDREAVGWGSERQMEPDELVEACGRAVAGRLRELLGDELVAAYLVGSGALGGVAPGRSDVDVVAVCAGVVNMASPDIARLPDPSRLLTRA